MDKFIEGIGWYLVFIFSLVLHEAAHAFTAWKLGDWTAYREGIVTLNPYPHMRREPFGTVIIPILTYVLGGWMAGWGSSPYDPLWADRHPGRAALMSIAGPLANLLLVVLSFIVMRIGLAAGFFAAPQTILFSHYVDAVNGGRMQSIGFLVSVFFSLNILLFLLNLLPLPPLDGSGVLRLIRGSVGDRINAFIRSPIVSLAGIMIAWKLIDLLYPLAQNLAIKVLYPWLTYS